MSVMTCAAMSVTDRPSERIRATHAGAWSFNSAALRRLRWRWLASSLPISRPASRLAATWSGHVSRTPVGWGSSLRSVACAGQRSRCARPGWVGSVDHPHPGGRGKPIAVMVVIPVWAVSTNTWTSSRCSTPRPRWVGAT